MIASVQVLSDVIAQAAKCSGNASVGYSARQAAHSRQPKALRINPCLLCRYEFQCQYGSIGWSVGATLGSALALKGQKRVIACIGDGSFQVTATVSPARSWHPCPMPWPLLDSVPRFFTKPNERWSSLWHSCCQPTWG